MRSRRSTLADTLITGHRGAFFRPVVPGAAPHLFRVPRKCSPSEVTIPSGVRAGRKSSRAYGEIDRNRESGGALNNPALAVLSRGLLFVDKLGADGVEVLCHILQDDEWVDTRILTRHTEFRAKWSLSGSSLTCRKILSGAIDAAFSESWVTDGLNSESPPS